MNETGAVGDVDVVVIGAGVVGAAIARELSRTNLRVVLFDAARDVGAATSKANTAILHTGFDATPGTVEARLVARGYNLLRAYCQRAGISMEATGALLVAWDQVQVDALPGLIAKAEKNGYHRCRPVGQDELRAREPHLGPDARAAVEVPDESIVDPWTPPIAFAAEAVRNGVLLGLGQRVFSISRPGPATSDRWIVGTSAGEIRARAVVNAAGLGSGRIDEMAMGRRSFTITPRRGQLIVFDKCSRDLVSSIILPVPTAMGKGVLVSPTVFGNVMLGPTAEDLDSPGAETATQSTPEGIAGLLEKGRRICPELLGEEVTAIYAGLRAATESSDFQLYRDGSYVCVGGIRSTGLTASMALAEVVRDELADAGFDVAERPDHHLTAPEQLDLIQLGERSGARPWQDAERIADDPSFGALVCHCEKVSRGELVRACSGPIPAVDLDGIRRRTRALAGRCQGFHCLDDVAVHLAGASGGTVNTVLGSPA